MSLESLPANRNHYVGENPLCSALRDGETYMSPYSTRTTMSVLAALTVVSLTIAVAPPADAQVTTLEVGSAAVLSTEVHWTAASLANAKPLPLPRVRVNISRAAQLDAPPASALYGAGRGPSLNALPDYNNVLFAPRALKTLGAEPPSVMPEMFGTNPGYRFTSSRVTQDAVAALGAEAKYPTAIAGQLFFKVPGGTTVKKGNYVCSATVQRARIITTAGHCVSDGSGHFFKNWVFVPALRNGVGPFGTWKAAYVVVSDAWHLGGGVVPNAQDVASIELLDSATGNKIGDVTGYAGYSIPGLYGGQHLTSTGYPCNIDSCNKMHRVDAEARLGSNNTAIIGSDMRGGSSGGGWLMNWGEYGAGEPPASGQESGLLRLIAVSSYGPVDLDPLYTGASILDSRYVNSSNTGVLDVVCAHRAGNC